MSANNGANSPADWQQVFLKESIRTPPGSPRKLTPIAGGTLNPDQRPAIRILEGDRHAAVDQAEAIIARRADLYQHADGLVRMTPAESRGAVGQSASNRIPSDPSPERIVPVNFEWLATELSRDIRWENSDGKKFNAPRYMASALVQLGHWPHIRPLDGIARAPILRVDGTVRTEPGYDALTRLYLVASDEFLPVPENPSREDAKQAAELLGSVFEHYTFANQAHISVALSLILTRLARHLMPLAPFHLITSSSPGTGKTEIVKAAIRICDGTDAILRSWPEGEEELRKVLTSCVMTGQTVLCFDNFPNGEELVSAVLSQFLTSPTYQDRLLGKNTNISAKNNMVLTGTGNNVTFAQDSVRRVVVSRVMPKSEKPYSESFPWKPSEYARDHRRELLLAAFTVLSAFIRAGKPKPKGIAPLGSFEEWSGLVRNALIWLNYEDPCTTQDEFLSFDSERENLSRLMEFLSSYFGVNAFSVTDVITTAGGNSTACREFGDFLKNIYPNTGAVRQFPTVQWLGKYFKQHRDKVVGGHCISGSFNKGVNANRWSIKPASELPGVRVVTSSVSDP